MNSSPRKPESVDFGTRFVAWLIDACLLFGGQWFAVFVLSRLLQSLGLNRQQACFADSPLVCQGPNTLAWTVIIVVMVVGWFGYHAWFDGVVGATPGKRVMGLAVEGADGAPAGWALGVARSLVRQGSWLWGLLFLVDSPLSFDGGWFVFFALFAASVATFVVGAFAADGRALHDKAASTRVVWRASEPVVSASPDAAEQDLAAQDQLAEAERPRATTFNTLATSPESKTASDD